MEYRKAMRESLISIIVPVYKVENYIRNCIESVQNQTYTHWELILVDDGSPDNSGKICDEYQEKDNRIRVIHKENGGLSSARNAGLDLPPKGEYVTFLDSDDFWREDYLSIMINLCLENDADMSQCSFIRGTENFFPAFKENIDVRKYDNHSIFLSGKANVIVCGKLYKVFLFDDIRMPVGLYNEDDWTTWKLYYRAKKIAVTTQRLYYYTENPSSIMGKMKKKPDLRYWGAYDERIAFFQKKGEEDLEHCSRLQLCKSLTMLYSNRMLTQEERLEVKKRFSESWNALNSSPYISKFYKSLFLLFNIMPKLTSTMAIKLYHAKMHKSNNVL